MSDRYTPEKKKFLLILTVLTIFLLSYNPVHASIPDFPNLKIRELKYEPYPAEAGKYIDLWIKVENYGSEKAENVTCILNPKYPFSLDPDEEAERNIGSLPVLEEVVFQYQLRVDSNAIEGWREIEFKCTTNGEVWVTRKPEIKVESKSAKFAIGKISSEPLELTPDSENVKLTLELQNIGDGDAKLVTTKLNLPQGFTPSESYSNIANLGTINNESSKEAVFHLDVDEKVQPKIHEANLSVKYKDSSGGEYKKTILPVKLNVKPVPLFEIEKTKTTPSILKQGSEAKLRVNIKNVGTEEAKEVSAKIYKQSDQPFDFDEKYDYIGDLKTNQSNEAVYDFSVDKDADLKKYLLDLEIRYVEGNDVKVVTKTVSMEVSEEKETSNMIYLVPIAIIILIIVGLWKYEKKKK